MVHKYDGSVRTSVLTSRFGMISVQQGETLFFFFQWFTEHVALSYILNIYSITHWLS